MEYAAGSEKPQWKRPYFRTELQERSNESVAFSCTSWNRNHRADRCNDCPCHGQPNLRAAELCNLKVVTDGNPDYTDIGSMIHSATSNWPQAKDKCWALWYWNHIARRQTAPMILHGRELTDPIRQFNDYGYTMCSTVSGVNCGIWGAMGLNVKFWDISLHTVPEVEYDGRWHMYDSSLSAIYTLCDGKTIAGSRRHRSGGRLRASGGRREPGHIAQYHCLTATSQNGFLAGCDTIRSLADEYRCFNPRGLKYRYYYNNWDLGHRYVLNLRDGEVYTRYYHRLDADSPDAVPQIRQAKGLSGRSRLFRTQRVDGQGPGGGQSPLPNPGQRPARLDAGPDGGLPGSGCYSRPTAWPSHRSVGHRASSIRRAGRSGLQGGRSQCDHVALYQGIHHAKDVRRTRRLDRGQHDQWSCVAGSLARRRHR